VLISVKKLKNNYDNNNNSLTPPPPFFFFLFPFCGTQVASTDAEAPHSDPQIGFEDFARLIGLILSESNTEAKKQGKATIPVPTVADLKVLFGRADTDGSKSIDEYEFLGLYQAVMEGQVKGLGKRAFSFYIRPHQLLQFGQHNHVSESTGTLSLSTAKQQHLYAQHSFLTFSQT
jgi:hypothetical protein